MLSELQKEEILELISLKQEGAYWDFKKEWYEEGKQPDLLHDIICMSNNLENRDAYIITRKQPLYPEPVKRVFLQHHTLTPTKSQNT